MEGRVPKEMQIRFKRMSADVYAKHGFFFGKQFRTFPLVDFGIVRRGRLFLNDVAEQGHLQSRFLLVDARNTAHQIFVDGIILRAVLAEPVEGAAENQRLHHPFVDVLRTAHQKIGEIFKLSVFLALPHDLFHSGNAHAFQRAEPEA